MKTKLNKLPALLLALLLVCNLCLPVSAHPVPDVDRLGSITITTRRGNTVVTGGTLALYRVGEVVEDDGNYSFQPTGDFIGCGASFADLTAAGDIALGLQDFVRKGDLPALAVREIGSDGRAVFDGLAVGLYLIVQPQAAPGYGKLAPFLIALPYLENGEYRYDLSANPKTDLEPVPTDPPPSTEPGIPQTGQLWWPVAPLACAGLLLFAAGMALNRRRDTDES